jgi:putative oxidoreductase
MDVIFVLGRVIFSALFARSGVQHLQNRHAMAGYAKAKGAPLPELTVPLTGVMLLAGAASIALGLWADVGALLIIAFLLPTALIMHAYWRLSDPQERAADSVQFYKDISLLGAAVLIFYLYNQFQDPAASLTNALFGQF